MFFVLLCKFKHENMHVSIPLRALALVPQARERHMYLDGVSP